MSRKKAEALNGRKGVPRIESMYVGSYEVIGCTGSKSVKRESNVGMQNLELKVRCGSTGKFLPEDNYYS